MSLQLAVHQVEGYRVNTPVYEGPLDLLLQLIERAELDITSLALAQVTDQYLAHLRMMQKNERDRDGQVNLDEAGGDQRSSDPAEVSGFLVIAARLVQIKSAALLPRPSLEINVTTEEEDPGEALARQLIQYKRFKELTATLTEREAAGYRTHLRVAPPAVKVEPRLDLDHVTLEDLVRTAREVFFSKPNLPALSQVVSAPRVTIREKIHSIVQALRQYGRTSFNHFLQRRSDRLEIVVTFLAMLELIKRRVVEANQPEIFGSIEVTSTGEWNEQEDTQLEFIE